MTEKIPWEPGKEYRTRGGERARVYALDGAGSWQIHGAVSMGDGWHSESWDARGHCGGYEKAPGDLMPPEPEKRLLWLNVYETGTSIFHHTREDADMKAGPGRIARIRVELVEGRFDE